MAAQSVDFSDLRFVTVNEPPANYVAENGELEGYAVDIIQQLQDQLHLSIPIEVMPEARAIHTLNNEPNIVMFSISRTQQREKQYHWLAKILTKRWILYAHIDKPIVLTSLDQLIDLQTIGVVRGDIREQWLKTKPTRHLVSILNYENSVEMLLKGRIDLLFYESFGMYTTLAKLGYATDQVKPVLTANQSDVYIVMSKSAGSNQKAQELKKQLSIILTSEWNKLTTKKWLDKINTSTQAEAWVADDILHY